MGDSHPWDTSRSAGAAAAARLVVLFTVAASSRFVLIRPG